MPLNKAQLEVLNELLIDPFLAEVVEEFRSKKSHKFQGERELAWIMMQLFGDEKNALHQLDLVKKAYGISEAAINALINLRKIYIGEIDIFKNQPLGEPPTLVDVRIALLNISLDLLQQLPSWAQDHYRQPPIPEGLEGMAKIRALFKQYMSTGVNSLERVLLATQITLEKEKLGIPSKYPSDVNFALFGDGGTAPGDFSGLDLSKMSFHAHGGLPPRAYGTDVAWFVHLDLHGTNLEGSDFNGFKFVLSEFDNANLRGAFFNKCIFEDVSSLDADIEGMHSTKDVPSFQRAKNSERMSRTIEDLMQFRREKLGMPGAIDALSSESASCASSSPCSSSSSSSSSASSSGSSASSSASSMSSSSSASSAAAPQDDELVDAVMRPQRYYLRARRHGTASGAAASSAAAPVADNKGAALSARK